MIKQTGQAPLMPQIILEDWNLQAAERRLCVAALELAGNLVGAAKILGITRHALKRRMIKLKIDRPRGPAGSLPDTDAAS